MERDRYRIFEPEGIWITRNLFHFILNYLILDTRLQFFPDDKSIIKVSVDITPVMTLVLAETREEVVS